MTSFLAAYLQLKICNAICSLKQAGLDWLVYTVIRYEKVKHAKVTSSLVFLSSIKLDDGYQIGRRVSPDSIPRDVFLPVSSGEN